MDRIRWFPNSCSTLSAKKDEFKVTFVVSQLYYLHLTDKEKQPVSIAFISEALC